MNDKELQGITHRWECDLDKKDYLVYPKNVVIHKGQVVDFDKEKGFKYCVIFEYKGGDLNEKVVR